MEIIKLKDVEVEDRGDYSIKRMYTAVLSHAPQNAGIYETTIPPNCAVKNHFHASLDEIIYFITKGYVKINFEEVEFDEGDLLILDSGDSHEIFAKDEEVRLIAIKLPNKVDDKVIVPFSK
ncbi:MAG: hypothetical protein IIB94_06170 [Candidatus Marinimicrobia bacterium]|nr:hypothetical protein [Candidatus Neomarinimicrobiota bacterium]